MALKVLVNGGSRGIGKAIVELFSREGHKVAFTYNSSEREAIALSEKTGAYAIKADSRSEADVIRAVKTASEQLSGIDCLINNAGISRFALLTDITLEDWSEMISVNLTAPFLYSREAARIMISRKQGKIINVSSMWGLVGSSCESHYSASKAGLIGLTKALAKELGPSGITVNAVAPGVINTDMCESLDKETLTALSEETPLCRIGEAEEVARAVYYLASDGASFITGEVLNVSGGFVI
ncbi:MAG: 3-oxoacyl-ACP reductase FabG [Clostridia bacterium]|nr:3-oxoacyl-ACP reductase FabG [Clostridia bacterium]MBO5207329.1 3-oxoacyl-ACP reductase FabG [Clostridia bacterium]MBP3583820.1 3-oxoacyl-ACP reductase FabG [Clostridia bacterium]MBQ8584519.1 3-oxoacyl-ACP reductase FabG [Clostridia bacterium]